MSSSARRHWIEENGAPPTPSELEELEADFRAVLEHDRLVELRDRTEAMDALRERLADFYFGPDRPRY